MHDTREHAELCCWMTFLGRFIKPQIYIHMCIYIVFRSLSLVPTQDMLILGILDALPMRHDKTEL